MGQYIVRPALCLDLDWTVRRPISDGKFIKDKNDIMLMPNVEEKIWEYKNKGYLIIGVTNQGSVAYGYKTIQNIQDEHAVTEGLFKENPFDLIYTCYNMLGGIVPPYNLRSLGRKPDIGMLASAEFSIWHKFAIALDWDNSFMVGDMQSDMELAKNANVSFKWAKDFFSWG